MKNLFVRWLKAFIFYFCAVVTLHSLVEYVYTSQIFMLQMVIMGHYLPSAYVYGLVIGLILSLAHFVIGKTIRKTEEQIIEDYIASRKKAAKKRRKEEKKHA
jgi:thiamine transporter ThiT